MSIIGFSPLGVKHPVKQKSNGHPLKEKALLKAIRLMACVGIVVSFAWSSGLAQVYATPVQDNAVGSWTDTFAATASSLSANSQANINTATGAVELTKSDGSGSFVNPRYLSGTAVSATVSPEIYGKWRQLSFTVTNTSNTSVKVQVYKNDGTTLVPDADLPGNSTGFSSSPVNLSAIPYSATGGELRLKATLSTTNTSETPQLQDWTVTWDKNNGISTDPAPPTGPWPMPNKDNRSTNQMDGTLSASYVPVWANMQVTSPSLVLANGQVASENYQTSSADPISILTLSPADGSIQSSIKIDGSTAAVNRPLLEASTKDNTIYFHRNDTPDGGTTIKAGAVRNGQLLWSRNVNEYSGYGGFLNLDNDGNVIMKSGHGALTKLNKFGEKLWESAGPNANYWNWGGPVSVGPGNVIYNKGTDAQLQLVNPDGILKTATIALSAPGAGPGTPSGDTDGSVYTVTAPNGSCFASSYLRKTASDGTLVWERNIAAAIAIGSTSPVIDDGYIYLNAACSNQIFVYDKQGSLVKSFGDTAAFGSTYNGSLIVDHSHHVLEVLNEKKLALYGADGSTAWNYSFANSAYQGWIRGWKPIGTADQWYAGWGRGVVSFKPFILAATADKAAYRPGETVSVEVSTPMPAADPATGEANKLQLVLTDGSKSALTFSSLGSDGNAVWKGSFAVPAAASDGAYSAVIEATAANTQTATVVHFDVPSVGSGNTGISKALEIKIDNTAPTGTVAFSKPGSTPEEAVLAIAATDPVVGGYGSGMSQMKVSATSDFANVSWEPYQTEKTITLGDSQTAYVKFRDIIGNESAALSSAASHPVLTLAKFDSTPFKMSYKNFYYTGHRPVFIGTAAPGAIVKVYIHSDPIICETTANAQGAWSCTPDKDIPDGDHSVVIQAYSGGQRSVFSFNLGLNTGLAATGQPTGPVNSLLGLSGVMTGLALAIHLRQRRHGQANP